MIPCAAGVDAVLNIEAAEKRQEDKRKLEEGSASRKERDRKKWLKKEEKNRKKGMRK